MDTEEDQHDLCRFYPCRYLSKSIMFFLGTERAFHRCGSHSGKFPLGCILHLVIACPAFLGEGGLDFVLLAERSVIVSGVTLITTYYPIDEFSV